MSKEPEYGTRRCYYCSRHSWCVANGKPCPWCGRRTGKYAGFVAAMVVLGSLIAIGAVSVVVGWFL